MGPNIVQYFPMSLNMLKDDRILFTANFKIVDFFLSIEEFYVFGYPFGR